MKRAHDNDINDCIGVVYAENDTELSWPIRSDVVYDENQIGELHDELFKYGLRWTQDRSNRVWSMTKTWLDNDVTDCIGLGYTQKLKLNY